jgi:hypothetical protein
MATEPLRRRHFFEDPRDSTLHPLVDNNNVQIYDTQLRDQPSTYVETAINTSYYVEPLERAHGSGAHGWGIASGLSITATLNNPNVKIKSGIAVDLPGRHICLAEGGSAEIGPNADNPTVSPQLASVVAAGVELPTAGLNGAYYVTIAWCETLDQTQWTQSMHTIPEMRHTPWLRLEPVANITDVTDDGSRIVLGRVQINAGNVTGLTHERRREISLPAGTVRLLRGATTGPSTADNIPTADIRARAAGGLELRVAEPAAQVDFYRDDGTNVAKTIQKVSFGADQIVARRGDGKETVSIDSTQANLTLGTNGVEGDLLVRDAQNRLVITLDGHGAAVVVGAAGNEGDILVKDNAGQNSMRVDGNTGTTFTKRLAPSVGDALDVDSRYFRVHGWDLLLDGRSGTQRPFRALVDLNNRLVVNYATDYQNGVDVNKLHLADHIKVGFWELDENGGFNPPHNQYTDFFVLDTGLPWDEWNFVTSCEIGMQDFGTVNQFWWATINQSHRDPNSGNIIIQWQISINDTGNDWFPSNRKVFWLAFRR